MLYIYLMISRNKDNRNIEGFKQRFRTILEDEKNYKKIKKQFQSFIRDGKPGETARLYKSINPRDEEKIKRKYLAHIIEHDIPVLKFHSTLGSVAMRKECAAGRRWLFDIDEPQEIAQEFAKAIPADISWELFETMNGYGLITETGFDTRPLFEDSRFQNTEIELKRDGLALIDWKKNC